MSQHYIDALRNIGITLLAVVFEEQRFYISTNNTSLLYHFSKLYWLFPFEIWNPRRALLYIYLYALWHWKLILPHRRRYMRRDGRDVAWEYILIAIRTYCYYLHDGDESVYQTSHASLLWQLWEEAGEGVATGGKGAGTSRSISINPLYFGLLSSRREMRKREVERFIPFLFTEKTRV